METVLLVLGLLYLALLLTYVVGWLTMAQINHTPASWPFVTVILPFRNEAKNLSAVLAALSAQRYPGELEILAVNDHSTDDFEQIFKSHSTVCLLHAPTTANGKEAALRHAINQASGEYVLMTDADCLMSEFWVRAMVRVSIQEGCDMVTGPLISRSVHSLWPAFQSLDLIGLMVVTAGGIRSRIHGLANGANLLIRKSVYEAYDSAGLAVSRTAEDLAIVQWRLGHKPRSLRFCKSSEAIVTTRVWPSLRPFIAQRLRWAAGNADLPQPQVTWIWAFVWLINMLALATIPGLFWAELSWSSVALFWGIKLLAEGCLLLSGVLFVRELQAFYYFPPAFLVNILYVAVIGVLQFLPGRVSWKGRDLPSTHQYSRTSHDSR